MRAAQLGVSQRRGREMSREALIEWLKETIISKSF